MARLFEKGSLSVIGLLGVVIVALVAAGLGFWSGMVFAGVYLWGVKDRWE